MTVTITSTDLVAAETGGTSLLMLEVVFHQQAADAYLALHPTETMVGNWSADAFTHAYVAARFS